jgi:hypothetical protein
MKPWLDLVIIPTFDRPEFLWLCLENLWENVRGATTDKEIWICEDIHADKPKGFTIEMEMLAVLREWESKMHLHYYATAPHTTYGNSYNVLNSLSRAASMGGYRYVYLLEDDVLVTPDFFEWNEAAQNKFNPWATCAGRLNRSLNFQINGREAIDENVQDPNACHKSVTAYISWATCFSEKALQDIRAFNAIYDGFEKRFEQDVMIQRKIRAAKLETVWPYVPRAFHLGWYSYHRDGGMRPSGTLEEKVKYLRAVTKDPIKLHAAKGPQEMDAYPRVLHKLATELYLR